MPTVGARVTVWERPAGAKHEFWGHFPPSPSYVPGFALEKKYISCPVKIKH